MGPISPSTVHRILAHISPLEEPLPPNLISRPLLQRHHFLGLTPEDAGEYIAWPSTADPSHVLLLLEGQTLPPLGDHLNARYTTDSEDFLAHVSISSHLRLVFLWEKEIGWQYHDLAAMPFPPNSVEDFNEAYILHSMNDFLSEQNYEVKASGGDDDDSYWNSYGQQVNAPLSVSAPLENADSEDSYWARYYTIQGKNASFAALFLLIARIGSADSTIPSPLPPVKNIKSQVNTIPDLETFPERVIIPSSEFQVHRVEPYNPLEPPSPAALSRRLQALSNESTTPLLDEPVSNFEIPPYHAEIAVASPNVVEILSSTTSSRIPTDDHDPFQVIMQDTIKNLYKLWRLGKQDDHSAEQDKNVFILAVQHALEEL